MLRKIHTNLSSLKHTYKHADLPSHKHTCKQTPIHTSPPSSGTTLENSVVQMTWSSREMEAEESTSNKSKHSWSESAKYLMGKEYAGLPRFSGRGIQCQILALVYRDSPVGGSNAKCWRWFTTVLRYGGSNAKSWRWTEGEDGREQLEMVVVRQWKGGEQCEMVRARGW